MTLEPNLTDIIEQNANTVDQNAEGLFDINEFTDSDFIYQVDMPIRGSSISLYNSDFIKVMHLFSPIGLNEER